MTRLPVPAQWGIGVTGIIHPPRLLAEQAGGQSLLDARVEAVRLFGDEFIAP